MTGWTVVAFLTTSIHRVSVPPHREDQMPWILYLNSTHPCIDGAISLNSTGCGDSGGKRISEGGIGGRVPEILTVPFELCVRAKKPMCRHRALILRLTPY